MTVEKKKRNNDERMLRQTNYTACLCVPCVCLIAGRWIPLYYLHYILESIDDAPWLELCMSLLAAPSIWIVTEIMIRLALCFKGVLSPSLVNGIGTTIIAFTIDRRSSPSDRQSVLSEIDTKMETLGMCFSKRFESLQFMGSIVIRSQQEINYRKVIRDQGIRFPINKRGEWFS